MLEAYPEMAQPSRKVIVRDLDKAAIRVLLVDDQLIVGEAVGRMIAPEADIVLEVCHDAADALSAAIKFGPTVILQDLVMPGADGLSLIRYYRAHPKLRDVPLVVLSSKEEPLTKAEAFRRGASDYLVKLPDPIELIARIRHHSQGYINLVQRNEAYAALLKSQKELSAEVASAAKYVESLLPTKLAGPLIASDWRYIPSAQLGGDSFGYHWIDDAHFAMYLLDVSGHGVSAALLSVSAMNMLRSSFLPAGDLCDPARVMSWINRNFQMEEHNNLFFTMWYGVYETSSRLLRHSSAGHPPALLMSPSREISEVIASNTVIGAFPDSEYVSGESSIAPKSSLFLISDGTYEVDGPDGRMWGLERLEEFLQQTMHSHANELDLLYAKLQKMHGPVLDDDFSILRLDYI